MTEMVMPGSLLLRGGIPSSHNLFVSRLLPFGIAGAGKGSKASRATSCACCINSAAAFLAAAVIFSSTAVALPPPPEDAETFSNVPQLLSGDDKKQLRIQRPKSRAAEKCTSKCVDTCIRGGAGSPGEGPFNVRSFGPLIVFKEGFRSRQYCLVECSDICNLIKDGEDGP